MIGQKYILNVSARLRERSRNAPAGFTGTHTANVNVSMNIDCPARRGVVPIRFPLTINETVSSCDYGLH